MSAEPLRSVMSGVCTEDTSLALPSDRKLRSGQERVLQQVHTVRRTKSKRSFNGSESTSPTSPGTSFRYNDGVFVNGSYGVKSGYISRQGTNRRQWSTSSQWERTLSGPSVPNGLQANWANNIKYSCSNPELVHNSRSVQRTLVNRRSVHMGNEYVPPLQVQSQPSFTRRTSTNSNGEIKISTSTSKNVMTAMGTNTEMTLKEAVDYLSSKDENYQELGASYIQHVTFNEEKAKQEVLRLKGIPGLLSLLHSPSPQVQQAAASALRNLVFQNSENKKEVMRCNGVKDTLGLLKETDSAEIQKQLTGLLWNLSSAEDLRNELTQSGVPLLIENVLVPFAGTAENSSNMNIDPEVFYNATGCLRNLSSAKESKRTTMRNCNGLIDSLVRYVQDCLAANRPDDKSVENCVCTLHNLTYQLESEAPSLFSRINALGGVPSRNTPQMATSMGCFSTQSSRVEHETCFDYPVIEENNAKGVNLLFHSSTMQMYLSLLEESQKEQTNMACMGALQNLTAHKGTVSNVMSRTIVQKLNGLKQIVPQLESSNPRLQGMAVALIGNVSRAPGLQSMIARQALPQLTGLISSGSKNDDDMALACQTVHSLLKAEPEMSKKLLNNTFVNSLFDLNRNGSMPKTSKAAGVLLYSMWNDKDFQSFLKKQGMQKGSFVNDFTQTAYRSVQTI